MESPYCPNTWVPNHSPREESLKELHNFIPNNKMEKIDDAPLPLYQNHVLNKYNHVDEDAIPSSIAHHASNGSNPQNNRNSFSNGESLHHHPHISVLLPYNSNMHSNTYDMDHDLSRDLAPASLNNGSFVSSEMFSNTLFDMDTHVGKEAEYPHSHRLQQYHVASHESTPSSSSLTFSNQMKPTTKGDPALSAITKRTQKKRTRAAAAASSSHINSNSKRGDSAVSESKSSRRRILCGLEPDLKEDRKTKRKREKKTSEQHHITLEPLENTFFDSTDCSSPAHFTSLTSDNSQKSSLKLLNGNGCDSVETKYDKQDIFTPINPSKICRKRHLFENDEDPDLSATNELNNEEPYFSDHHYDSANIDPDSAKSASKSAKRWTPEEDDLLRQAVKKYDGRNWKMIAAEIPGRNHFQCLQRWEKALKPGLIKGHWRPEEDQLLITTLSTLKFSNWGVVAAKIPGRTAKQCRERWTSHLDPTIQKREWTEEEDQILKALHKKIGSKWSEISELLPGRTENNVKLRMRSILSQERKRWTLEDDLSLIRARWAHGNNWEEISKHVKGRKCNSCKFRWRELVHLDKSIQTPRSKPAEFELSADSPIRLQHKEKPLPEVNIEELRVKAREARALALDQLAISSNRSPKSPIVSSSKKRHQIALSALSAKDEAPNLQRPYRVDLSDDHVNSNSSAHDKGNGFLELSPEQYSKKSRIDETPAVSCPTLSNHDGEINSFAFSPKHANPSTPSKKRLQISSPFSIPTEWMGGCVSSPIRLQLQQQGGMDAGNSESAQSSQYIGYRQNILSALDQMQLSTRTNAGSLDINKHLNMSRHSSNLLYNNINSESYDLGASVEHSLGTHIANLSPIFHPDPHGASYQMGNEIHLPPRLFSPAYSDFGEHLQSDPALEMSDE